MSAADHVVRHPLPHPSDAHTKGLHLSNRKAFALVFACEAVKGLDDAALARLAGKAHPRERAELLPAFARLADFLATNGWTV